MRSNRKSKVRLVAASLSCAGMIFVLCNAVWPQEVEKTTPRIKELQQKRLTVLKEVHDVAARLYQDARTAFEEVHAAQAELLSARLEYAETKEDRIKACDEAVQEAREWHEAAKAMVEANRASRLTELRAQAYLFEAQIAREKAEREE